MPVPRFTGSSSKNNVCVRITAGMQLLGTEEFGSFGKLRRYFNICYAFLCYFFKFPQGRFFVYCVCVTCLTRELTGPTREVCGHKRKFQSSFPRVLEHPCRAGNRRCCGGAPWWWNMMKSRQMDTIKINQDTWILCESMGYSNVFGVSVSRHLISGFGMSESAVDSPASSSIHRRTWPAHWVKGYIRIFKFCLLYIYMLYPSPY